MTNEKSPSYFTRLFAGRLNRQNYIIGSTLFVLPATICFTIVLATVYYNVSLMVLPYLDPTHPENMSIPPEALRTFLFTPTNQLLTLLGVVLLILSFPFLLSMQIRRQHDLNLPGWLWVINVLSFASFYTYFPSANAGPGTTMWWVLNTLATLASLFSLYCTLWPGTHGPNKYGESTVGRISIKKDVLVLD